jgi:hypothetical protein
MMGIVGWWSLQRCSTNVQPWNLIPEKYPRRKVSDVLLDVYQS